MSRFPFLPGQTACMLALAASASEAAPQASPRIEIDSTGARIVASDPLGSDAMCSLSDEPTFFVGDNEDEEEQWFTRVLGVARLSGGSVAVADAYSSEVRIFDATGAHVRSMGRGGEGPGEFGSLWRMWHPPGDTLWEVTAGRGASTCTALRPASGSERRRWTHRT